MMYNYYRQGWIVGRLVEMAKKVFGAEPIVISLPYMPSIKAADSLANDKFTFIIAGKPGSKSLESIRKKLQEDEFFWVSERPLDNESINGYRADAAAKWPECRPRTGRRSVPPPWTPAASARCPPTTGRSSTCGRPRSRA